jgi:histidine triad (HIT) family protein
MNTNCIFCKIAAGQIPCHKIYEDEKVFVFLDINPVTDGHTLVIPKAHHEMIVDTPDELMSYVFIQAKKLMRVLKEALGAEFVAVSVVGTDVPHFHVHLIPRYKNDGLANFWPTKKYQAGEEEEIIAKIKNITS